MVHYFLVGFQREIIGAFLYPCCMNLAGRSSSKKCLYIESGNFAGLAIKDAAAYGDIRTIASSKSTWMKIPPSSSVGARRRRLRKRLRRQTGTANIAYTVTIMTG